MIKPRIARLAVVSATVARIYTSYKVPQVLGRAGLHRDTKLAVSRRHRRNAEALYALAARLQGLMIKPCSSFQSRGPRPG
jgi:hypothetical protein